MIISKPYSIPISCLELTINNRINMTKRTIIYHKIPDAFSSCAPPFLRVFSNHPNLLLRDKL